MSDDQLTGELQAIRDKLNDGQDKMHIDLAIHEILTLRDQLKEVRQSYRDLSYHAVKNRNKEAF